MNNNSSYRTKAKTNRFAVNKQKEQKATMKIQKGVSTLTFQNRNCFLLKCSQERKKVKMQKSEELKNN